MTTPTTPPTDIAGRPTLETDSTITTTARLGDAQSEYYVPIGFARTLEQQRDALREALEKADSLRKTADSLSCAAESVCTFADNLGHSWTEIDGLREAVKACNLASHNYSVVARAIINATKGEG